MRSGGGVAWARTGLCAIFMLGAPGAFAEEDGLPVVAYPDIVAHAGTLAGFVPAGWRLEATVRGRLDDDAREDAVLLLRMDDPANLVAHAGLGGDPLDSNPRLLVAVLAEAGGGFRRAAVDRALIPRADNAMMDDYLGDDPASAITITRNRGVRVALHSWASAGSWSAGSTTFTFRLQDGCFRLIGYDRSSLHRGSGETEDYSANLLTGKAWSRSGSMEQDAPGPRRPAPPPSDGIVCLGAIGDGFAFSPTGAE